MSYTEEQIKYETSNCFVLELKNGAFEVYENGITHATRVAFTSFTGQRGFKRAVYQCNYRQHQIDRKVAA